MNENNYIITPQNLLDVVEEVAMGMPHMDKWYLVEYNKARAVGDNLKDGIKISIDDVLTPIRAFKWDYLVGNVPREREFVITDNKKIGYFIHVLKAKDNVFKPEEKRALYFAFEIYRMDKNNYPIDENGINKHNRKMNLALIAYPMKKEMNANKIDIEDVEDDFPRRIYELLYYRYTLNIAAWAYEKRDEC